LKTARTSRAVSRWCTDAVYGILFDTGKAEIKPESAQAIGEVAKLLKADMVLKLSQALDDDVAAILKRLARTRHARLKDLVNEALRRGLASSTVLPPARETFRTTSVALGRCRMGTVDNVADTLAAAEGESFR
jgi:hypothetical protein